MVEEKDASKILEIREEMLALAGSWSNVHYAAESLPGAAGGRWLVVDETGGLLVAAMAERMGILYPEDDICTQTETSNIDEEEFHAAGHKHMDNFTHPFASSNTLTLLHTNAQPNLSLLQYFHYTPNAPSSSSFHTHPLASHLLPLSWLQLISPHLDSTYSSLPPIYTLEETREMKSGKRGTYYRKLRRYNRTKHIVDSTLAGKFDGLAIASSMSPESILRHTIPLVRGGAPIVIYSPTIEPLVQLSDFYSTSRRTAFIQSPPASFSVLKSDEEKARWAGDEDFPLNPTLVLNASVQTARVREWQVLPGRTHPLMTGRGGAEGYLFTGVRVRPAEGRVEARGKFVRKKEKAKTGERVVKGDEMEGVKEEEKDDIQEKGGDIEMSGS
jgi:tRNA (adenine-N(1)-)-methyltransferase non-catalytic subunit